VEKRRRPVLGHGGTPLPVLDEIVLLLLNLGMVCLRVSLIDERGRMERLLIVGWMMHLKGVAMRMLLGKCEILVVLLLGMEETLQIFCFLRMPASCLLPLLLLSTQLLLLMTMKFLRVVVGL